MKKPGCYCIGYVEQNPMYKLSRFCLVHSFSVRGERSYLAGFEMQCSPRFLKKWKWLGVCCTTARILLRKAYNIHAVCVFNVENGELVFSSFIHHDFIRESFAPKDLHFYLEESNRAHLIECISNFQERLRAESAGKKYGA